MNIGMNEQSTYQGWQCPNCKQWITTSQHACQPITYSYPQNTDAAIMERIAKALEKIAEQLEIFRK